MKTLQRRIQEAAKHSRVGPFVAELPDVERVFVETRKRLDAVLRL